MFVPLNHALVCISSFINMNLFLRLKHCPKLTKINKMCFDDHAKKNLYFPRVSLRISKKKGH